MTGTEPALFDGLAAQRFRVEDAGAESRVTAEP